MNTQPQDCVRRWASALPSLLALFVAWVGPGHASAGILTVDGSHCKLVDAFTAANRDAPAGGCPAGSGEDTLLLTAAVYTLTQINNDGCPTSDPCYFDATANGLPMVTSAINLNGDPDGDGKGAVIERSKAPNTLDFRLLHVERTGKLVVRSVTFRNGYASGRNRACGGAILNYGTLSLIRSTVRDNRVPSVYGSGAGLCNDGGVVMVEGSVITGNRTEAGAGGIANKRGTISLGASTVSDNRSEFGCGGMENLQSLPAKSSVSVVDSTLSGNGDSDGFWCGGIYNEGAATITNSTVADNRGAGIVNAGTATLSQVTISGNIRRTEGAGGVSSFGEGKLSLTNSLVANNAGGDCGTFVDHSGARGTVSLSGVNLIEDGSCEASAKGARTGDPDLGQLANNDGFTKTQALMPCSTAIDAANDALCPKSDQRGVQRPQGQHCDIGAFELVAPNQSVCLVNFRSSWKRILSQRR